MPHYKSMIDSIGLGGFLASVVISMAVLLAVIIFLFLIRKKSQFSIIWLSCSLNVIAFLYFMGTTSYFISTFNIIIWPIINLILIVLYVRKKKQ